MDTDGFRPYRGYFYRASVNFGQDGQWRGRIDIFRRRWDGTTETVISKMDVPGSFIAQEVALAASDAYCHVLIDDAEFQR